MARFKELDDAGRQTLADTVNTRMTEIGMHQAELKRESGVSELTIRQMQTGVGHGYRESTIAKVSVALFGDGNELLRRLQGGIVSDLPTTGADAVGEMLESINVDAVMRAAVEPYMAPIMHLLEEMFDEVKSLRDEVTELRGAERRSKPAQPKKERRRGRANNGRP